MTDDEAIKELETSLKLFKKYQDEIDLLEYLTEPGDTESTLYYNTYYFKIDTTENDLIRINHEEKNKWNM